MPFKEDKMRPGSSVLALHQVWGRMCISVAEARLETIVGNVNVATLKEMDLSDIQGLSELKAQVVANEKPSSKPLASEGHTVATEVPHKTQSAGSQASKEDINPSRYIGSDFWVNLVGEVEGLKQALAQSTDSDTEDESTSASPETTAASRQQSFATQGLLAGYPSPDSAAVLFHPPDHQVQFLLETFFDKVDPIIKILHRPTILKMVSAGTSHLTIEQEALQFSIYFAAVTSLTPQECLSHMGQDQMTLFKSYQLDVERALAAADYLNNSEMECIQAFLLYVACLRVHNESRASWVLTAMLLRLAQAFDIWHDGDGSRYTVYQAELRRRLWWQVVVLDIRASEDRGTEAMIDPDCYNTRLPLNINDEDFGPETTVAPPERTGPSDVTFSLCTAQSSSIFLWVGHAQSRFASSRSASQQSEDEIIAKAQDLEQKFITNHDPTHFQAALAAALVRMINLKLWLIMQYPLHTYTHSSSGPNRTAVPRWSKVSREAILQTAVSVMELHEHKHNTSKEAERFRWWGVTYVQWHPLAVALAELCAQTRGPLVARAWKVVQTVYPKWALVVADSKRGALWRPIRKLYKKAKGARAASLSEDKVSKDQAEAFQRLELLAGGGVGVPQPPGGGMSSGNSLPTSQEQQRRSLHGIELDMLPTGLDFGASLISSLDTRGGPMPMDFEITDMTPSGFYADPLTGWPPNINFDMPPDGMIDPMNWTVWNEFIDDTQADAGSRTGSSEDEYTKI
ncbi:hypothetical protein TruAng_008296 [Truncatella angustata]|nr:hypothetical protein TruAng_008296 [Truncatella angustata]